MDKNDWIITKEGVDITKKALPPKPEPYFFSIDAREINGNMINFYCSSYEECQFDKKIANEDKYYATNIFLSNRGKRINNVFIKFDCSDINLWGVAKLRIYNFRFESVSSYSSTILFSPFVDQINYVAWSIFFKTNEKVNTFSCNLYLVSDELKEYKETITIQMPY